MAVIERCPRCGEDAPIVRDNRGDLRCTACGTTGELLTSRPKMEVVEEGRYRLTIAEHGIRCDVDRLRRERHQLVGELAVHCNFPGARTFDGILSIGDCNFSSVQARSSRAKHLASRGTAGIDWDGILEEFSHFILGCERSGAPSVSLRDVPRRSSGGGMVEVEGVPLLTKHPMILFGDGGSAKSYLALFLAGTLAARGARTGIFDWELSAEDHRDRLERLFGAVTMPDIRYVRCAKPLHYEVDRLRRVAIEDDLDYVIYDSIAFACDGPPESAEVASRYFQAVRQIGPGSLHVAHVNKSDAGDLKPFGSTFWHNGARSTWNVRITQGEPGDRGITVGLTNRKANIGPRRPPISFRIDFSAERTAIRRV